jgi:hypothetical protein
MRASINKNEKQTKFIVCMTMNTLIIRSHMCVYLYVCAYIYIMSVIKLIKFLIF